MAMEQSPISKTTAEPRQQVSLNLPKDENFYTLRMLVANKPGVLGRVALVFSRRGFNIESISVSHTPDRRFSRMIVSTIGRSEQLTEITKQTRNLIDVLQVTVVGQRQEKDKQEKYLQISGLVNNKTAIMGIIKEFGFEAVDFSDDSITVMVKAWPDEIEAFVAILKYYGTIDFVS